MWHQCFNCNVMKLREYFFLHKENKNNNFIQQFLLFRVFRSQEHHNVIAYRTICIYCIRIWNNLFCIVPTQMRAQRRRKSGSVRTESECSEGRGTMVDIEMASQTGSLRRGRSRMDTGVSVASDPFSSGLEGVDEDHYGYVLPTERGKPILHSQFMFSHYWDSSVLHFYKTYLLI